MKSLCEKITDLRIEKGWTVREMASKIPMSHAAYIKIEKGITQPSWDRILRIATIHGISPAELVHSEVVTLRELKTQTHIDDLFEILNGMNLELRGLRDDLAKLKHSIKA
ncbi:MAG: helix-turn-helix domain-containing protein [Bacteroidia bacterium]|jgi:transcriptional regulator with XRE-family HTH domain|nr:helix-turn-helix domain-containing protein [Bacteroidia bacterium]